MPIVPTTLQMTTKRRTTPVPASATHPAGDVTCIITSSCSGDESLSSAFFRNRSSAPGIPYYLSPLRPVGEGQTGRHRNAERELLLLHRIRHEGPHLETELGHRRRESQLRDHVVECRLGLAPLRENRVDEAQLSPSALL